MLVTTISRDVLESVVLYCGQDKTRIVLNDLTITKDGTGIMASDGFAMAVGLFKNAIPEFGGYALSRKDAESKIKARGRRAAGQEVNIDSDDLVPPDNDDRTLARANPAMQHFIDNYQVAQIVPDNATPTRIPLMAEQMARAAAAFKRFGAIHILVGADIKGPFWMVARESESTRKGAAVENYFPLRVLQMPAYSDFPDGKI